MLDGMTRDLRKIPQNKKKKKVANSVFESPQPATTADMKSEPERTTDPPLSESTPEVSPTIEPPSAGK